MKILVAHNSYLRRGGEDVTAEQEMALLRAHGHSVVEYRRSNAEIAEASLHGLPLLRQAVWAADSHRDFRELVHRERPDIAHFHNTFTMISPSAYYACAEYGVPIVQTVQNYRLLCPNASLFRNGQVCESCVTQTIPWSGLMHR